MAPLQREARWSICRHLGPVSLGAHYPWVFGRNGNGVRSTSEGRDCENCDHLTSTGDIHRQNEDLARILS